MRTTAAIITAVGVLLTGCTTGTSTRAAAPTTVVARPGPPTETTLPPVPTTSPATTAARTPTAPTSTVPATTPPTTLPVPTTVAPRPWGLGVYAGGPTGVQTFEEWLGRPVNVVTTYLDRTSWDTMTSSVDEAVGRWRGRPVRLSLAVPLLPARGATLAKGANGAYDEVFRSIARQIVDEGGAEVVIRLGWEFDGNWYPWSGWKDPKAFVAYWRRVVGVMRSVDGQRFRFDWNSAADRSDPSELYPGDDVVDVIGLDVYDQSYDDELADPQARWQDMVDRPGGLAWLASFSTEHGKPMSLPEWGLTNRHVDGSEPDNPRFVEGMHEFVRAYDVLYHNYFDTTKGGETWSLRSGDFPESADIYRALFGAADPVTPAPGSGTG